jgi:hypothetical protein
LLLRERKVEEIEPDENNNSNGMSKQLRIRYCCCFPSNFARQTTHSVGISTAHTTVAAASQSLDCFCLLVCCCGGYNLLVIVPYSGVLYISSSSSSLSSSLSLSCQLIIALRMLLFCANSRRTRESAPKIHSCETMMMSVVGNNKNWPFKNLWDLYVLSCRCGHSKFWPWWRMISYSYYC